MFFAGNTQNFPCKGFTTPWHIPLRDRDVSDPDRNLFPIERNMLRGVKGVGLFLGTKDIPCAL